MIMNNVELRDGTVYITVRDLEGDGSKAGKFFVNGHSAEGGFQSQSNNHRYNHKRTARVMGKRLAAKLGVPYRQDLEYTGSNYPKDQTPVGSTTGEAGAVV
jgi:hypothetical protein